MSTVTDIATGGRVYVDDFYYYSESGNGERYWGSTGWSEDRDTKTWVPGDPLPGACQYSFARDIFSFRYDAHDINSCGLCEHGLSNRVTDFRWSPTIKVAWWGELDSADDANSLVDYIASFE